ncbi:uncharacterized protein LOC121736463 isoform X2 [Aricia agestis]|uniref:uncharacterized protein LOC121736463 isoform X2 n=1 Tax=Aricia agestis TaxID=91739 RepID=UPI001C20A6E1|nr:uncharacterized protein LOC121736463 isoform X2 [Aricia agestis]
MCKAIILCFVFITGAATSSVDNMEWWEYWKLCGLAAELVVEAKNRIHQTDNIKDMLAGETGFEVGMIMGKIRDKYRTMMELYRMTNNKFVHNPDITLPAMTTIKPLYYIVRMEMIHALEVEIDSLVRVLEALPTRLLEPSTNYLKNINQEQLKWAKEMEKYNPTNMEEISKMEEQMKEYNKDKYLRTHQQQSQIDFF